jgi:hypothetical protein
MKRSNPRFLKSLRAFGILIVFFFSSCSSNELAPIAPLETGATVTPGTECYLPFVESNIQFIHSLNVSLPGSANSIALGVTSIYPAKREFESVIMSIEGLVLFHSRFRNGKISIQKSVGPFSDKGFQEGLVGDIQLIFLSPDGRLAESGRLQNDTESIVCRFQTWQDHLIDVSVFPDKSWVIKDYNPKGQLNKTVRATTQIQESLKPGTPYPDRIVLKVEGLFGYSLTMDLIDFEVLD